MAALAGCVGASADNFTSFGVGTACRETAPAVDEDKQSGVKYNHVSGLADDVEFCKELCNFRKECKAVEYKYYAATGGRCEIWFRDVNHTETATGFQCFKYTGSEKTVDKYIYVSFNLTMTNVKDLRDETAVDTSTASDLVSSLKRAVAEALQSLNTAGLKELNEDSILVYMVDGNKVRLTFDPSDDVHPLVVYEVLNPSENDMPNGKTAIMEALKNITIPNSTKVDVSKPVGFDIVDRTLALEPEKGGNQMVSSAFSMTAPWALMVLALLAVKP